jgi:hypothetical protein
MRARMPIAAAAAILMACPAAAGAQPTAVAVINGDYEGTSFTTLVAVARVADDRVAVNVFRVDSAAGAGAYRLAIVAGKCSTERPQGQAFFQALVNNESIVHRRVPVDQAALGGGAAAYSFDAETGEIFGCAELSKFSRVAQIVAPRDPVSGDVTGLVAVRKQHQRAHFTLMLGGLGDTGTHVFGASRHRCSDDNFTATDDLWQFKRTVTGASMDFLGGDELLDIKATRSLAVVKRGVKGPPEACGTWHARAWAAG